jgi:acylpyruvate hydrolase
MQGIGRNCEKMKPIAERLYKEVFETVHNKVVCIGRNYADHAKEM